MYQVNIIHDIFESKWDMKTSDGTCSKLYIDWSLITKSLVESFHYAVKRNVVCPTNTKTTEFKSEPFRWNLNKHCFETFEKLMAILTLRKYKVIDFKNILLWSLCKCFNVSLMTKKKDLLPNIINYFIHIKI